MKIYTENILRCCECPNCRPTYGGHYCGGTYLDIANVYSIPETCPLPNVEEPCS